MLQQTKPKDVCGGKKVMYIRDVYSVFYNTLPSKSPAMEFTLLEVGLIRPSSMRLIVRARKASTRGRAVTVRRPVPVPFPVL